jgi:predicted polyphosphate/ATP-dependent NAD kinase
LIVNPIAGIGGAVGLKGSDGELIQRRAISLGAKPAAQDRSLQALKELSSLRDDLRVTTYPKEMGEDVAKKSGFVPSVIGQIESGNSRAMDTIDAAARMKELGLRLILFTGGDGTARDMSSAIGTEIPVVGIPSGVKMHSAVFANTPRQAGQLVKMILEGRITRYQEAEVMDLDESAYRDGEIAPKLYGYLRVPKVSGLIQSRKRPSNVSEAESQAAIATWIVESIEQGCPYILGPGTTTRAITEQLGLAKTLIGVDVIKNGELVQVDANEDRLLELLAGEQAKIVISPIGGQGHLFGRGNQQISGRVISKVGKSRVIVVCTPDKLHSLEGKPLRVDSGEPAVDAMLAGYLRVVTGYNELAVYQVVA